MSITKIMKSSIQQLKYWLRQGKPLHRFALTALTCLTLCVLLLGLTLTANKDQQLLSLDNYGKAISRLASNQLAVPMSASNLIGLQSLLKELVAQDRVINAVIYGVDNRIVVQAGSISDIPVHHKAYTQELTLDQSLLGSLTLTLDVHLNQTYSLYGFLLLSFLALAGASARLLQAQAKLTTSADNFANGEDGPLLSSTASAVTDSSAKPSITEAGHQAIVVLQLDTIDKLYQQLNADARQQELQQLQSTLSKVLTLYSGQQLGVSGTSIVIGFQGRDQSDCLFQSLCCAHLLQRACDQQQWLLKFTAHVSTACADFTLADDLKQMKQLLSDKNNLGRLLIKNSLITAAHLESRIEFNSVSNGQDNGMASVIGFTSTYQQLLNNQLSHLL
jgi:uncharacterized membrane protein affecting hemolysin expression